MITLPQKIRKNGYNYTLTHRGDRACVFCQEVSPTVTYYEVSLIRKKRERVFILDHVVKLFPAKEVFPANEDFGQTAWTYNEYKEAVAKFNELENHEATQGIL